MRLVYVAKESRQCGRCHGPMLRKVGAIGSTAHPIVCWLCWSRNYDASIDWQVEYFFAAEQAVAPRAIGRQESIGDLPF